MKCFVKPAAVIKCAIWIKVNCLLLYNIKRSKYTICSCSFLITNQRPFLRVLSDIIKAVQTTIQETTLLKIFFPSRIQMAWRRHQSDVSLLHTRLLILFFKSVHDLGQVHWMNFVMRVRWDNTNLSFSPSRMASIRWNLCIFQDLAQFCNSYHNPLVGLVACQCQKELTHIQYKIWVFILWWNTQQLIGLASAFA